jgi:MFS transporter, PAT family, beta-lactamase induction signal transducer AmpG
MTVATSAMRLPFPAISESRALRLALCFLLYAAQGVPIGLFSFAIPGWLAANGASAAQVGAVLGAASLPWTLKFLNGFLMDRFAWLPMGRRRPWLIVSQGVLLLGLAALALRDPAVSEVAVIAAFAFVLNLAVNFQDVAVDGMAADLVPDAERARTSGMMFGGQAIGISATTAIGALLLRDYGLRGAALAMGVYALFVLLLVLLCRERPGEKLLPWTAGAASPVSVQAHVGSWRRIFTDTVAAMLRRPCVLLCLACLMFGIAQGISEGVFPLIATQTSGLTQVEYSSLVAAGKLASGLMGIVAFGLIADHFGPLKLFRASFILAGVAAAVMLLVLPSWVSPWPITLFVLLFLQTRTMHLVGFGALAMGLCRPAVAATQMTLFAAVGNLGKTVAAAGLGLLDALGGQPAMVAAMLVALLAGLALALMKRAPDTERATPVAAVV